MDLLNAMRDVCQRKDMRISGMTVGMSLLRNSQRLHKIIETHKDFFWELKNILFCCVKLDRTEMGLSIIKC